MEIIYEDFIEHYADIIDKILSCKGAYYHSFSIPKINGGMRHISEPVNELKNMQKLLKDEFFYPKKYLIHKCAYAYIPGISMKQCIEKHTRKSIVVKMDIKNFFGSITDKLVYDSMKYTFRMDDKTAKTTTELCTFNGVLVQGALTSPILSNFVCRILDRRLYRYCSENEIEYSRYADDMIFSGSFDIKKLIHYVSWAIRDYYGFKLNYDKLRIMRDYQRQVVLGVLVNNTCRLTKNKRHELRQMLYYIKKYGTQDYICFSKRSIEQIKGYVSYALGISDDPFICELHELLKKEV